MATGRIPINGTAAIQETIVDAKGDLIVATGADAVTRLAVVTNGHILVADSSTPTGLAFAAPAGGGWSLITSGTLSSTSTNVTGLGSSFTDLRIIFREHRSSTDGANLFILFNATDTIYNPGVTFNGSGTADTYNSQNAGSTDSRIAANVDNTLFSTNTTQIFMPRYSDTSLLKSADVFGNTLRADLSSANNYIMYKNRIEITGAITEFTVFASAGNLAGSYYVYGI